MEWEDLSIFVTRTRVGWQCGSCWGLSLMRSQVPSSKFLVWNLVRLVEHSNQCNKCVPECIRDRVALNKKLLKKAACSVFWEFCADVLERACQLHESLYVTVLCEISVLSSLVCGVDLEILWSRLDVFCPLHKEKFPAMFLGVCLDMPAAFYFSFLC